MELTLQNRKILMAAIIELQQAIDEAFVRSELLTMNELIQLQNERVTRLEHFDTRYGESGDSTDNRGIG